MVYDAADGYIVMYQNPTYGHYLGANTTWEYSSNQWTPLHLNPSPSTRYSAGMVYDAKDRYVLLFGGASPFGGCFNDTWTFSAGNWTQLSPGRAPPLTCSGAALAFDASDGYVVYFAGKTTWKFLAGQWKDITNYGHWSTIPKGGYAALAYDSADKYVVLFDTIWGCSGCGTPTATWKFHAGNWTNLTRPGPPTGRSYESLVDDPADGYVLMFGGTTPAAVVNQSWTFVGGNWSLIHTSGHVPVMAGAALAYDPVSRSVVAHPGNNSLYAPRQTWSYSNRSWAQAVDLPGPAPPARWGAAWDGTYLIGGCGGRACPLSDIWAFESGFWINLTGTVGPGPSARYGAAYASAYGILFGGTDGKKALGDTWVFNGRNWRQFHGLPASPSPRFNASLTYDLRANQGILFGGTNGSAFFNDTWLWEPRHGWVRVTGAPAPDARAGAQLLWHKDKDLYSPLHLGEAVLFGGHNQSSTFSDVWDFSQGVWAKETRPSPANLSAGGRVAGVPTVYGGWWDQGMPLLYFGGQRGTNFSSMAWVFEAEKWFPLTAAISPPARALPNVASTWDFQLYGYVALLFGGVGPTGMLSDVWEFDLAQL